MDVPETRYAKSVDVSIVYQILGDGPYDLVRIPPFVSHTALASGIQFVERGATELERVPGEWRRFAVERS